MKNLAKHLVVLLVTLLFIACQNSTPVQEKISGTKLLSEDVAERSVKMDFNAVDGVDKFDATNVSLSDIQTIPLKSRESLSQKDREDVSAIMRSFMSAENTTQQLDVELMMSEEPIEDGVFVFAIETPNKQTLAIQMYDEEGFEMAANNRIALEEGTNYKAMNVKSLENGQYIFLLKDLSGKELMRKINIEHQ